MNPPCYTSPMSTLFVVATPIGNLEDMTHRAIRVLGEAGAVACEDTRRTRALLSHFSIPSPRTLLSYREQTEARAGERILGLLSAGADVALVSDAGYPGISDAGYRIISSTIEAGHRVEVIPGAGAISPALLCSGLPTSSFTFKGFPPRKPGVLRRFLLMEADLPHTLVFYESPARLGKFLTAAFETLGDRRAAVCLELTKKFERVHRGFLSELAKLFADAAPKGEVTVVIAGANRKFARAEPEDDAERDPSAGLQDDP
jgi:16S rRNA (cytidine1402-2'-O)-methyltransferase